MRKLPPHQLESEMFRADPVVCSNCMLRARCAGS